MKLKEHVLALLLILFLLPSCAFCETVKLEDDIRKGGMALQDECFLYNEGEADPVGYEDPTISVNLSRGRFMDTNYILAFVKIQDASQLRTAFSGAYNAKTTDAGATLARRMNAVLALNGDFYVNRRSGPILVARQKRMYRNACNGTYDVLVIDASGDMHILPKASKEDVESFPGTVVQGLTFGPGLVIDGEFITGYVNNDNAADKPAQRMILCQTGELEYMVVAIEGPEDPGSVGLDLEQATDLLRSIKDVTIRNAYNLDGGSSTTLVFRKAGSRYAKINSPLNPKTRSLCDIVYFASAWQP